MSIPFSNESGFKVYFLCDEVCHLEKDYPLHVFKATPISKLDSRDSTRGLRGRGDRAHVGSHGASRLGGG